jgi:hypothetical protein
MTFGKIKISIRYYRECNNLTKGDNSYLNTAEFDKECGLKYYSLPENDSGYFYFNIVDESKYLLAKIKYGI